ncbi:MAG: flagellar biosynthesis protein FliR [Candidatus Eremiobacteraeota bacterium]|nr:flagellar biosynthesis protein FliR [Candidatus Eremiobacteraeota bacterium]
MSGAVNLFGLTAGQFETFLLVLVRVSVILLMIPIFQSAQVNLRVRFGLGLSIAFVVWHTVPPIEAFDGLGPLTAAVISQALIGFVFGFIAFLVFVGIQFAGEVMDLQVGFSIVNVINPLTSQNVSILGELQLALGSLIYLISDAHHFLFAGLSGSFNLLPLPFVSLTPLLETNLMAFFSQAFFMVFQIAAPVGIALFLTNIGLALMARVAPQLNVFAVGFPLQIMIGLVMIIISLPLLEVVLPQVFSQTPRELDSVLRAMRAPG